jgi:hypothetical protein
MQRIPKYTAGMFKKKMPRFGSSSIKMPRMPKPPKPRVKKFAEGGDVEFSEERLKERGYKPFDPRDPKEADLLKRLGIPYEEIVRIRNNAIVAGKKEPYRGSGKAFREPITGYDEETDSHYLMLPEDKRAPYKRMVTPLGTYKPNKNKKDGVEVVIPRKVSGDSVKKMASGGSVSSASKRADGCATKGKTRGKFT